MLHINGHWNSDRECPKLISNNKYSIYYCVNNNYYFKFIMLACVYLNYNAIF